MVKEYPFVDFFFHRKASEPDTLVAKSNLGSLIQLVPLPLDIQNKFKTIQNAQGTLLPEASTAAISTNECCYVWKFSKDHSCSQSRYLKYPESFSQLTKSINQAPWVSLVPVDPEYCATVVISHLGKLLVYKDPLSSPLSLDLEFQDKIHSVAVSSWSILIGSSSKLVSISLDTDHSPVKSILERPQSIFSRFFWSTPRRILAVTSFQSFFYVLTDQSLEVWQIPMKHHQPYFIKESINLLEIIKDAIEHFHVEELVVDHLGIMIILKSFTQRRTSMLSGASPPTGLHFVVISDSFSSSPNLVFYSHTVAENVFASLRLNESLLVSNFTFGLEISDYTSQRSDVIEWPSDLHRLLACKKGASSNSSFFILDLYHGILEFRAEYESSSLPDMEPQNVMQVLRNVIYFGRTATHLDLKVSEEDIENMTKELFHSPLFVEGKLPIEKLHKQLEYFDCLQRFIVESQLVHNLSEQLREFILIRHISLDCLLAMYKLGKSPSVDALYPFLLESMLISSKKNPNDPQGLHEINTNTIMLCEVLLKLVKMAELYVIKTPKEGVTHLCDLVEVNLVLLKHQSIMRSELEQDCYKFLDFLYFVMDRKEWRESVRSFFTLAPSQAYMLAVSRQDALLLAFFLANYPESIDLDEQVQLFAEKMPDFLPAYFAQLYHVEECDRLLDLGAQYPEPFLNFLTSISPSTMGGLFYLRCQQWEQAYLEFISVRSYALEEKEIALSLATLALRSICSQDSRIDGQLSLLYFQRDMDMAIHVPQYMEKCLEQSLVLPVPCLIDLCRIRELPLLCRLLQWMSPEDVYMMHVKLCRRACLLLNQHPSRVSPEITSNLQLLFESMQDKRPSSLLALINLDDTQWLKLHATYYNDDEVVKLDAKKFLTIIHEEDKTISDLIQSSTEASQLLHKLFSENLTHVL